MKCASILAGIAIFLSSGVASATPADDSNGADLVRATLVFQDTEDSVMTDEQRFSLLYLLGYVDGCARTLQQSGLVSFDDKTDLPSIFKELVLFIGDRKILRSAPATDLVNAFLLLNYGDSQETRHAGLSLTMKIVGKIGAVELAKAKQIVEQGGAEQTATAPESNPEGDSEPQPESEDRPQ